MAKKSKAIDRAPAVPRADFLEGIQAIADHLGVSYRRAHYMTELGELPTFMIAGRICARPSTINRFFADRENAAIKGRAI